MKINLNEKQIDELLSRGVNEVIDFANLKKRLMSGEKLRFKLGIDPTSSNVHLGRAVALLKLKDFQKLGHQVIFIVGDFTGVIGDTSDKESERPMLSEKEVQKNMKDYIVQAGKILDIEKTEICFNSKWLAKLKYAEIGKQANQFSLTEFINRENIKKRLTAGARVSLRELLYPLMQAYDSVMVKADVEIGGTDQRFNLLTGRTMQPYYKQKSQDIIMLNLIPGIDGRKMSSSWGNTINIFDKPNDMFGKIMSITDDLIIIYFEHCTRISMDLVRNYSEELKSDRVNPRDIKMKLAYEITKIYWGDKMAIAARDNFISIFQKKNIPTEMPKIKLAGKNIVDVLVLGNLSKSKGEARHLIEQKGIKINGKIIDLTEEIVKSGDIIQKGKRYFLKII